MGSLRLPSIVQRYVDASNKHDVPSIVACFSDDAVVQDEGETLHGKKAIEGWIVKTIEKYKFHFEPLNTKSDNAEVVATIEVSGTFAGSPVSLDYHFTIENEKILSLSID